MANGFEARAALFMRKLDLNQRKDTRAAFVCFCRDLKENGWEPNLHYRVIPKGFTLMETFAERLCLEDFLEFVTQYCYRTGDHTDEVLFGERGVVALIASRCTVGIGRAPAIPNFAALLNLLVKQEHLSALPPDNRATEAKVKECITRLCKKNHEVQSALLRDFIALPESLEWIFNPRGWSDEFHLQFLQALSMILGERAVGLFAVIGVKVYFDEKIDLFVKDRLIKFAGTRQHKDSGLRATERDTLRQEWDHVLRYFHGIMQLALKGRGEGGEDQEYWATLTQSRFYSSCFIHFSETDHASDSIAAQDALNRQGWRHFIGNPFDEGRSHQYFDCFLQGLRKEELSPHQQEKLRSLMYDSEGAELASLTAQLSTRRLDRLGTGSFGDVRHTPAFQTRPPKAPAPRSCLSWLCSCFAGKSTAKGAEDPLADPLLAHSEGRNVELT